LSGHDDNVSAFINIFFKDNYLCHIKSFDFKYNKGAFFDEKRCLKKIKFSSNIVIEILEEDQFMYINMKLNGHTLINGMPYNRFNQIL